MNNKRKNNNIMKKKESKKTKKSMSFKKKNPYTKGTKRYELKQDVERLKLSLCLSNPVECVVDFGIKYIVERIK